MLPDVQLPGSLVGGQAPVPGLVEPLEPDRQSQRTGPAAIGLDLEPADGTVLIVEDTGFITHGR